jgi:hypothetical protein
MRCMARRHRKMLEKKDSGGYLVSWLVILADPFENQTQSGRDSFLQITFARGPILKGLRLVVPN